ncbi:YceI family protein [Streptomyces lycii]|uniref:YceI family protein n=1 Tax=Streptomyces lycii TaxID=2654337 RepID=UPI0038B68620
MLSRWRSNRKKGAAGLPELPGLAVPRSAGLLTCRVLDPVGQPVSQAKITVNETGGRQVMTGQTDPYGAFVAAVPAGGYQLLVAGDGYTPYRSKAEVSENTHTPVGDVTLSFAPALELPAPGDWDVDPTHSTIGFTARHIALARVHGRFNRFAGVLRIGERMTDSAIHVVIDAASIDTNAQMRDNHLRSPDFLDVRKYPTLEFYGDRFRHRGGRHWTVTGSLTIHGVSRSVSLDTEYLGSGHGVEEELRVACRASTQLHREDYDLNWRHMITQGIAAVGSTIDVHLDIQVIPRS